MTKNTNTSVTIELYGVPRLRAGTGRVSLEGRTLSAALEGLGRVCPGLVDAVISGSRLLPSYLVSLNGERFITDPETPLIAGDVLLLLSADVGG